MTEYNTDKPYIKYAEDVLSGRTVSCKAVYLACARFKSWFERDDIYFDYDDVDRRIKFTSKLKHSTGIFNNKPFDLMPWQTFLYAGIFGWKWVSTGWRVTKNVLAFMARKNAKTATMAAIALMQTTIEGEANAEVDFIANSGAQARIAFEMCKNYADSIDKSHVLFTRYRDSIKVPVSKSTIQVHNSDSMTLDGLNSSVFIEDEAHAAKTYDLWNVMKSSQGSRTQPLAMVISTAGYLLDGYMLFEMRKNALDILNGVKDDDTQFSLIYELDEGDDWTDEATWIKANPSLGVTLSKEYLREQVVACKNNPSLLTGFLTKNLNMFCTSQEKWLDRNDIAECMEPVDLSDHRGRYCYIGLDLASVSDFTALTVFIPGDKPTFKSYAFIPYDTYISNPNSSIYVRFKQEGTLIVTDGNVTDYDYVIDKIKEVNSICPVQNIFYDPYNATQMIITLTNDGFSCSPFSQALGNFNRCTKQLEMLIRSKKAAIDKSICTLWCFENTALKYDWNSNCKPVKGSTKYGKIDIVISMCTALGGYLCDENVGSNEIWVV